MAHSKPTPEIRAATPPTISDNGIPTHCAVFRLESDWGHFRRVGHVDSKQTYRIPPRTTLAGLLAAIVGRDYDSYYDVFQRNNSAIAVTLDFEPRTVTQTKLDLGTNPDESFNSAGGTGRRTAKVKYPDSTAHRQLDTYEYLVEPVYTVAVAVEDEAFWTDLSSHLEAGTAVYPPSMGVSELLASVTFNGIHHPEHTDTGATVDVDSVVPNAVDNIVPTGETARYERVPAFMEADETGRRTTGYVDYAFTNDPESQLTVRTDGIEPVRVGDDIMVFH